jgi:predicted transcriptional regulator
MTDLGGVMFGLGDLESAIMTELWRSGQPVKVREVLERLDTGKKLAYNTVMTVLDNLHRKGWVDRRRDGKAYWYWPELGREEAAARALRDVLQSSGNPQAVLLHLARTASDQECEALRTGLVENERIR